MASSKPKLSGETIEAIAKTSYLEGVDAAFKRVLSWLETEYLMMESVGTPESKAVLIIARRMSTELRSQIEELKK